MLYLIGGVKGRPSADISLLAWLMRNTQAFQDGKGRRVPSRVC
jgi:hypothetical protein